MNKINHYASTYQKDYTWPYVSSMCRPQPPTEPIVKGCTCIRSDSQRVRKEGWDGNLDECLNWSRMGPMGRLLEPKIYGAKIERVPSEADVARVNQLSCICLKEEYPGLYGALKKSLSPERITRVDADRAKTTYQADYSDPAAARMTQRDLAIATNNRRLQCSIPIKIIIEADCPPSCSLPSSRCRESTSLWKRDDKRKNGSRREKKCEDAFERRQMSLPAWKSEYQDSINKIGHAIIRAKLHRAKRKALPAVQYQYCTTPN